MNSALLAYVLLSVLLIMLFSFISYWVMKKRQEKKLQKIRESWGRQDDRYRDYGVIELFSQLTTGGSFHRLTPQVINDIDLYDVFAFIDRTNSKPGQQYLFNKIITPTNDNAELEKYNDQVNFFLNNKAEREEAQLLLSALDTHDAYYIVSLLNDTLLAGPQWTILFVADTILVAILLLLAIKFPVLLIWLILPLAINIFLYFRYKNITGRFNKSFQQFNNLITVAKAFVKKKLPFEKAAAKESITRLGSFQRKFRLLKFGETSKDEITQTLLLFLELIKAFFLIEIHSFFSCLKELKNKKEDVNNLLNYVGSIDAALSTASLRSGLEKFVVPVFTNGTKRLDVVNLYHPLIKDCVSNSISVTDKSILITGSNMSGKSTFIRTIAVNSILAQTIYTCFARQFVTPFLKVHSSVRITDSLLDAKSYYFEEVNVIGGLINESEKPFQYLFVVDEVLKGTNTIERIASAKAILSYLNKNDNIVFVSTHDIELAALLQNEFDLYHFAEDVENDVLVFDHKLKTGPLQTRNAIKLLELYGYPAEVTEEARVIAGRQFPLKF